MKNNDQEWNDEKQQILNEIMRKCFIDGYTSGRLDVAEGIPDTKKERASTVDRYIKFREGKSC